MCSHAPLPVTLILHTTRRVNVLRQSMSTQPQEPVGDRRIADGARLRWLSRQLAAAGGDGCRHLQLSHPPHQVNELIVRLLNRFASRRSVSAAAELHLHPAGPMQALAFSAPVAAAAGRPRTCSSGARRGLRVVAQAVATQPLTKDDLVAYLASGCKPRDQWRCVWSESSCIDAAADRLPPLPPPGSRACVRCV